MNIKNSIRNSVLGFGALAAMCAAGDYLLNKFGSQTNTASNKSALFQPVYAEEELTLEKIAEEVRTKTVRQILGDKIEVFDYTNYDRKKLEDYENLMILVYPEIGQGLLTDEGHLADPYILRAGIIFREVSKKYNNQIKFIGYNHKFARIRDDMNLREMGLTSSLSILMLSKKDILTGRTSDKNFVIDILRGGPTGDKWIENWIKILSGWIEYNFENKHPELDYSYRYENTGKIHKVYKK